MSHSLKLRTANMIVAIFEAATFGSLSGSILLLAVSAVSGATPTIGWDLFLIPVLIVAMSLVALFIVLPSLVLLGIPLAFVFAKRLSSPLLPAIAIILGALAGWMIAALVNLDLPAAGPAYGAATGLFWLLRVRPVMVRIEEDRTDASVDSCSS